MNVRPRLWLLVPAALWCLPRSLASQEAEFDETVDVRVVEVDVRVNDKKGRPVSGLTADDFILFDDGQPIPIEYFSVVTPDDSGPGARRSRPEPPPSPDGSETVAHYTPAPEARLPHLAIYLDQVSLRPADRDRVLDDLSRFVESLTGRRRISLFIFDGGLSIGVRPTSDPRDVLRGLEAARSEMTSGYQHELDEDRAMRQIRELYELAMGRSEADRLDCRDHWRDFLEPWRLYAEQRASLGRSQAAGLIEAFSILGALTGPKDLVYVSSGLTRMPGLSVNEFLAELCAETQTEIRREMSWYDLSTLLQQVTAHANRSRVTVHSLDAGGMRPMAAATVRSEDAKYRFSGQASGLRTANLQSGPFTLAEDTGGRAILNQNQPYDALLKVREDVEHGYILGFSPDRPPDTRTHRIRVSLRERPKGVELRFRSTYVDANEEDALIGRLLAALQLGWGGNPLDITTVIGEPERISKGVIQVPVRISVPAEAIREAAMRENGGANVRVAGVAMDSKGRRTVVRRKRLDIEEPANGAHLFEIRMKLPPEHYRIGLSLELEGGGETSYVVIEGDLRNAVTGS